MKIQHKWYLFLIVLIAVFFRLYQISVLPGGLFPDEAANGLDINLMQQGNLQPFYERGNGREALFFYMIWGSVELFGKTPLAHHLVSSLVGIFSVLFCFLLTRRLFLMNGSRPEERQTFNGVFSENISSSAAVMHSEHYPPAHDEKQSNRASVIALLASFLMAASSWHIVLSRTAFRANLIPLFSTLTIYLILCAYQAVSKKQRFLMAFLSGAAFALGFYTYIAYRILVPILGILVLWPLFGEFIKIGFAQGTKNVLRKYAVSVLLFAIGFAIFIYPIAKYFYEHRGSFVGRSGQVSVFNPELYTIDGVQYRGKPPVKVVMAALGEVTKVSVLGYFTKGDLNWRHNVSGQPFLSFLVSPFFGISLVVITLLAAWYLITPHRNPHYWKYALLAGWFWGMLIPVVTTAEGIPHGLRSIGTIPAVFIIAAVGMYKFGEMAMGVHKRLHNYSASFFQTPSGFRQDTLKPLSLKVVEGAFKILTASFCLTIIAQTYAAYFIYAASSPEYQYAFRADLTYVSQYLLERCNKEKTYLVLDKFSVQTTDYMTSDRNGNFNSRCNVPYKQTDPEEAYKLKGLKSGDQVVFTQSSIFDTKKFKEHHKNAHLNSEYRNKFNQAVMAVYEIK